MKDNFFLSLFSFAVIIFLFTSNSFAQHDTLVFNLDESIAKALANNWDMQLAKKDIEKSQYQINEAYSNAYPRIDFTGNYTRNILLPVLFLPPDNLFNPTPNTQTIELGSKNSFAATVGITQVLYNQKVNTAIKIAGEYASYSEVGSKAAKESIILAVKKSFYSILMAEQIVKVTSRSFESAKANSDNVAALFKQGVASEFDLLRSQVQVANIQPTLIQAENNLELALSSFKNLLTIDLNTPVKIVGNFSFTDIPQNILENANENAADNSPSVRQLKIQESLLEKNIKVEQADYYPTLAFFGQYQYQTQDNNWNLNKYNWAKSFMVGLQLTYNLFDGFGRGARIQQAVVDKEKVAIGRSKLEEGIKVQVLQSILKMNEAKKKIAAQEKSLAQADKALKIAHTRYSSGVGTQLEIMDTETALTLAQTNYSRAIYEYLIARSEWEYSVSIN